MELPDIKEFNKIGYSIAVVVHIHKFMHPLENAYPDLVDSNLPDWSENSDLMEWLSDL